MSHHLRYFFILLLLGGLISCGSSSNDNASEEVAEVVTAPAINTTVQSNYDNGSGELDVDTYQAVQNSYVSGEGQ